jgi:hypothetical protein
MNDWGNSINIQIYNAKYWQKMRDFIGLYHFEATIMPFGPVTNFF